jgi:hypothetical protein
MNERVKQLALQALKHPDNDNDGLTVFDNAELEKFAELIVREMCQVMKAEGEQFSLDQNFDAVKGVGRCMRRVKDHFGVEK